MRTNTLISLASVATALLIAGAPAAITEIDSVRNDALTGGGGSFTIQGTVTSTGLTSGRNQFTIQDIFGGIVVDDTGNVVSGEAEGDIWTIEGTTSSFNGLAQFVPSAASLESTGNLLPAVQIVPNLTAIASPEQAELVGIKNVFLNNNDDANWSTSTNYTIEDQSGNTMTFRIGSGTTDWATTAKPASGALFDVVGTVNWFNSPQIHARSGHQGDGTVAWNGSADTGPDVTTADSLPVELSVFSAE